MSAATAQIVTSEPASHLEQIASRAIALYSRPTVALQVMRLTEEPQVDAHALKECVAQDPALTCKVLRVVNSSLYGLNRPVADLNQAIGLLGIKPLKLLVLGFNLPDALFAEVAARELQWYWTNTLTRAVAARLIAEHLWHQAGDEAFTAGLLQDIGILVLLHDFGEPYARFLTGVIHEKCHLASLEQDTLGFDHVQLSAALLGRWQLPQRLVNAIALPKRLGRLSRMTSPEGDLPQILHLAELLAQLVGQRRLGVLPELLEAGRVYRGMTKSNLAALVEGLQPQVDQLAQVLSLELSQDRNYVQMLLAAHRQMSALSEQLAHREPPSTQEEQSYNQLLAHADALKSAMRGFLSESSAGKPAGVQAVVSDQQPVLGARLNASAYCRVGESPHAATLARKLAFAATRCRDRRQELSLMIVEPNVYDVHSDPRAERASWEVGQALGNACAPIDADKLAFVPLSDQCTAAILLNCERRAALALAHNIIDEHEKLEPAPSENAADLATTLSIGVATASVVPKNFDAVRMMESASRCLSAARACGISAVKSIEV